MLSFLIIWVVGLPVSHKLFPKSSAFSTSSAVILGWIFLSFFYFVIGVLNPLILLGLLVLWFLLNFIIGYKRDYFNLDLLVQVLGFVLVYAFFYFILGHNPQIYQIERFMDFGFVKALSISSVLPLQDIWFAGETLNYYYFGHFVSYTMSLLGGFFIEQGFYFVTCWLAGVLFVLILGTCRLFTNYIWAFMCSLIVVFGGPITEFIRINQPNFWYADATRIIKGTITEFPFFSFLEANIHAHVWGYVMGALVVGVLGYIFLYEKNLDSARINLTILSFLLGISFITNSWDILTLGLLSFCVLSFWLWLCRNEFNVKTFIWLLVSSFIVFIITVFKWYKSFTPPVTGLGIVSSGSDFTQWFGFWGLFVIVFCIFVLYLFLRYDNKLKISKNMPTFIWIIFFIGILFLFFSELFYVKDILSQGEWFRANTYFKLTAQLWIWFCIASVLALACVWEYSNSLRWRVGVIFSIVFVVIVASIYPIKTTKYFIQNKKYVGFSNPVSWLKNSYPDDYAAYKYLKSYQESLPQGYKEKVIVEASGESYSDNNYFSTLLGWYSVVGWPVHEWTWRGSYDAIAKRREEVGSIYQHTNVQKNIEILKKYNVSFIVVGAAEKRIYNEFLQVDLIKDYGDVVFESGETFVVKVIGI